MVGTECGGMDQTISIFAERDKVKLIEFNPEPKITDVSIPKDVSIVVAHSLTPNPKLLTLATRFNKRVVECRMALAIFCKSLNLIETYD